MLNLGFPLPTRNFPCRFPFSRGRPRIAAPPGAWYSSPAVSKPSARNLLPHEHGAYGQILVPLACALSLGHPGAAAWLLAAGAFAAFLSYEALLVLAGNRGKRVREMDGPRAARLVLALLGASVLLAGSGFWLAPPAARLAALAPPAAAAVIALLVRLRQERSVAGEVAVAIALASTGFPVAVASGARVGVAAAAWLAWSLGFTATTLAVEVVLHRARAPERDHGPPAAAVILALQGIAFALALAGAVPLAVPAGVAPLALSSLIVIMARIPARRLKVVGWLALAGSLLALAVLIAGLRG